MNCTIGISLLSFCLLIGSNIYSQNNQSLIKEGAPQVYIDCGLCDMDYIKEQIPVVNFVHDRKDADVHVLFTSQTTGSGGKEYVLYFIGENKFAGIGDTVRYSTGENDSDDLQRSKMVKALKLGLVRYIEHSKVADQMNISYKISKNTSESENDNWNFWYFKTSLNGNFNGDHNYKYLYLNGTISADRITEEMKLNFKVSLNYNQNKYSYESNGVTSDILSISRNQYFNTDIIRAISGRWSWGLWGGISSSIYNNIDHSFFGGPGIEYDIFPYSVSNERQLRISYKLNYTYNKYVDETLYFKSFDYLWSQSLDVNLSLIRPWGNMSIETYASDYLHDLSLYEMDLNGSVTLNLFKGFSCSLYGGYSKLEDQITLRRAGPSLEDVLTQRRQLETNYSFWGGFGISFSFGSIYNNIVNPRFGNAGGTTVIISY